MSPEKNPEKSSTLPDAHAPARGLSTHGDGLDATFVGTAADLASTADDSRSTAEATPPRPQRESIGSYAIVAELGRGGMGIVYQAQDRRLGRVVALKVILAGDHAGALERRRFQVEVESAGKLQHPNIVQVYEVGEDNGRPFMSMEFCPGGSLEDQIRDQPQPPREAAQIVAALADGLHDAHQAGIVHRDVKPANVLLAANGTPKLADFGLAKSLNDEDGLTQTGAIMGSLGYMAPEQALGHTRDATPATDIYSLGALLYKLLTGRPPFQGANQLETINSIVATDPVSIQVLQRRVPQDLVTICHKCLEKSPARRYPTAAALAIDLRHFLADQPILARPLGAPERAWRWARRHPGPTLVLLSGMFMLLMVAGCLAWSSYRSYRLMADVNDVQSPLQELSGRIRFLDEVLTSSALLASATGDALWHERYSRHVTQLDKSLQAAVKLAPSASVPLAGVDMANSELVEMETTAFDAVQRGSKGRAWELLNSAEYRAAKQRYGSALNSLIAHLDDHRTNLLSQARRETQVFVIMATAAAAIIFFLVVTSGWVALRMLRHA